MQDIILTGDRPTGPLHLGHYVGSLRARVKLQHSCKQFIIIADGQALTDNASNPEKIRQNIREIALDYLAVGIDPSVSTIFIQSLIPQLAELTMYFLNLVTIAYLQRNPTVKEEIRQREFTGGVPAGFVCYPVSQAADILAFKANLVPVGEEQLPMIQQAAKIARAFNSTYSSVILVEPKPVLSQFSRLPGTDGKHKMSKSLRNAIFLCDSPDTINQKVKMMYTDPNRLQISDPGTPENNPVFTYLDAFDPDKHEVEAMKAHCRRGGLGDTQVKKRLVEVLISELEPIRHRREEFAKDEGYVMNVLKEGTKVAYALAEQTLKEVREAMHIDYFS